MAELSHQGVLRTIDSKLGIHLEQLSVPQELIFCVTSVSFSSYVFKISLLKQEDRKTWELSNPTFSVI